MSDRCPTCGTNVTRLSADQYARLLGDVVTACWLNEDCIAGLDHSGPCRFPSWTDDAK